MRGSSLGYLLKTGFKNVYANRLMSFASIGVLVACLMLIGSAILFSLNVQILVGAVEDQNELVVFLDMEEDESSIRRIGEEISQIPQVEECIFYSSEEAWENEQQKWAGASEFIQFDVDGNELGQLLPDAYRIKLKDMNKNNLNETLTQLQAIRGVEPENINSPAEEATILTNLESAITTVGAAIVLVLAVVSIVIIANTIKITIFSRRKEINIMKLVGATNTFIKLPFIIEGMLIGLISALVAFGFLWVAYDYAMQYLSQNPTSWLEIAATNLLAFKDIAWYMLAGFAVAGSGLGVLGSGLFIRKHLKV